MHFELTEVLHEESGDGGQFNVHFLGRNPEVRIWFGLLRIDLV